ncbi:mitochondrial ribosomal protein L38 L homeolog [Xenopus laevis]|uniref:Large ribosomal subunit protein mL38 n=2 Tax=Xenopus laevis TaxID=8355 RepID=A0A8J0Q5Z8_XENLA|nr:mitochondrial ribosomal protein L38 L homeolog [Xenopus laevis]
MAAPLARAVRRPVVGRFFSTAVVLCKRVPPLGPMPNQQFEGQDVESLEKYRSFLRYYRTAEKEEKKSQWWKTYRQFQQEEEDTNKEKADIGFPHFTPHNAKTAQARKQVQRENRRNPELERAARLRTLRIPLDEVRAEWERTTGRLHVQRVAEHYGVFKDLFGDATFVPSVTLGVHFNKGDEMLMPVYHGNLVTPTEASAPPDVTFEAEEGSLWTLLLTNPDGHLRETDSEYVHWLMGNIPGNQMHSGEQICHYFPPFPAKGTGYHRHIFILFKQDRHIDFKDELRPNPCHSLKLRTFKTVDFYRKYEESLTPAGLAFFQCAWDDGVSQVYHQLLNMREPVFEYERPLEYHPKQIKYPHAKPLRYLDRYRDSEEPTYGIY